MKNSRHILFVLGFILAFLNVGAQDYANDLKAMYAEFGRSDRLFFEVEIAVFETYEAATPFLEKRSSLKKDGTAYLYRMDDITVLQNPICKLIVNSVEKTIFYLESDSKKKLDGMPEIANPNFDSIVKASDSIRYLGTTNGSIEYVIYNDKSLIKETHVLFNQKSHMLDRLEYYYNTELQAVNNKVIVQYTAMDIKPRFEKGTFSEKQYLKLSGGKVEPTVAYDGYTVYTNDTYVE